MRLYNRFRRSSLLLVFWIVSHSLSGSALHAQGDYCVGFDGLFRLRGPDGDPAITSKFTLLDNSRGYTVKWGITQRAIYASGSLRFWHESWPTAGAKTLVNTNIVAGSYNKDSIAPLYKSYVALMGNGDVYHFSPSYGYTVSDEWSHLPFSLSYEYGTKITGDLNYYGLSSQYVYVSRDKGSSWQVDSGGLGTTYPFDFSLDKRGYMSLATTGGLYYQQPDSSTWKIVSSFPELSAYSVFNDRLGRTFASTFFNVYYSTDQGTSWTMNDAGLSGESVAGFSDDAFGNIYARAGGITSPTRLFRSLGGTGAWTRIDTPMTSRSYNPLTVNIIDDVSGDTVLIAATLFGFFISTDQGTTWDLADCGLESFIVYGLEQLASGRRFMSTSLGIYYRGPSDTTWTKCYPPSGYLSGSPLFRDGADNLYTQALKTDPSNYFSIPLTWKSSDFGITWARDDTAGASRVQNGSVFSIDEMGTQHYSTFWSPNQMFSKRFGLPWTFDTSGYKYRLNEIPTFMGSDAHGYLYSAFAKYSFATDRPVGGHPEITGTSGGILWKRPIAGGTWVADTAGLNENAIYAITADMSGNPIVGTYGDGVYRRTGGTWSKLPSPPGLGASSAFVLSVDGSGALFAGFADLAGVNYLWRGVYFTTDLGASWTYAGLDSISIQSLKSYGDTTFAETYVDGVYRLTRTGITGVREQRNTPGGFALYQNYPNPFNPSTAISYQLSAVSRVNLKVYDVLGREVETLVNGIETAGLHKRIWNASRYASGVYFYRLEAVPVGGPASIATKKLLLIK